VPKEISLMDTAALEDNLTRLISRTLPSDFRPSQPRAANLDARDQEILVANQKVDVAPNDSEARLNRARVLLDMKRFKEAESDISAVLKHDAENLDARLLSAECHLIQRPGWISSVDLFALLHNVIQPLDKYLAMRPHDAKALRMRAHTRMLTGNPEGAESDWKEVVELHPDDTASRAAWRRLPPKG
jgi:tetratricopeptide (TPR) repeat protein